MLYKATLLIKTDQYVSMSMSGLLNFIVISDPVLVDMFDFRYVTRFYFRFTNAQNRSILSLQNTTLHVDRLTSITGQCNIGLKYVL